MEKIKRKKNNKKQDLIVKRNEAQEHYLMTKYKVNYGYAHKFVSKKYDYSIFIKKKVD
ncbi:hypothetical protein FC04_14750 [Staphylococcus aureus]|nr:hypothetical protein FC04_14750 [Staphylococcus aureus]